METESGGWTLVATKVSPNFIFIKTAFSSSAAKTTDADAASHIHPRMGDWEEVVFRFSDVSTIRVIYNRKASAPNNDKTDFDKFLTGATYNKNKNVHGNLIGARIHQCGKLTVCKRHTRTSNIPLCGEKPQRRRKLGRNLCIQLITQMQPKLIKG